MAKRFRRAAARGDLLLEHARAACAFATPTINGYKRYRPYSLAPERVIWGRDSRGALLRVLGGPGDPATRIENRIGEPAANPYLYFASQVHAGLDGIERKLSLPPLSRSPYEEKGADPLPRSLGEALEHLKASRVMRDARDVTGLELVGLRVDGRVGRDRGCVEVAVGVLRHPVGRKRGREAAEHVIAGQPPTADFVEHRAERMGAVQVVKDPEELLLELRLPLDREVFVAQELIEDFFLWCHGHRSSMIDPHGLDR